MIEQRLGRVLAALQTAEIELAAALRAAPVLGIADWRLRSLIWRLNRAYAFVGAAQDVAGRARRGYRWAIREARKVAA